MNSKKTVVIRREWAELAIDIIRFFIQHSTIEFDGANRKALVKYRGPQGWSVSISTSYASESHTVGRTEVLR